MLKNQGRILVVDDEEIVLLIQKRILERAGYEVHGFSDGESAVAYYQENWESVTLVILDKTLPGICGLGIFTEMKKVNPAIEAILSTGALIEYGEEIAGIQSTLQKPFSPMGLLSAVELALSKAPIT